MSEFENLEINVCYSVKGKCYNPMDSYGEICVGCNCCGRINKATKYKCRVETDKRHLVENAEKIFDDDFQTPLQQKNIIKNMQWLIKRINRATALDEKEIHK